MKLVVEVYRLTRPFPREELYGLTSQIRRSVIAIPSNIAEGYVRRHTKEYAQFVNIAFASGAELETQLEISRTLGYISKEGYSNVQALVEEIMKMLNKLSGVLRTKS